jgi:enterochelin esterase family protein
MMSKPGVAPQPCRVIYEQVESAVLVGNRFGDPTVRSTPVILPPSYDREPGRSYPTIYILAAFGSSGWQQLARAPFAEALDERLARLYASQPAMAECIVVLPDCCTALGGSQYVNSPGLGRYADHVVAEVVPHVDRRYRTQAAAGQRAVVGRSSGGIGAMWLAMNHPEVFGAVASHAGDGYFRVTLWPELLRFCQRVRRYGGPEAALHHWLGLGKGPRSSDLFDLMTVLTNGLAYSPAPNLPLGCVLPIDWQSGVIDGAVWQRWLDHDPVERCAEEPYRQALAGMRLLYLDAGTRDEYYLDLATRRLAGRLRELAIPVIHEEFDDGHRATGYRLDRSLPLVAQALTAS